MNDIPDCVRTYLLDQIKEKIAVAKSTIIFSTVNRVTYEGTKVIFERCPTDSQERAIEQLDELQAYIISKFSAEANSHGCD